MAIAFGLWVAYTVSYVLLLSSAFGVASIRRWCSKEAGQCGDCNVYSWAESRAPLAPAYCTSMPWFSLVVGFALVGTVTQALAVYVLDASEIAVAGLLVYNIVSAWWPVMPPAFNSCGLTKRSRLRPQAVVVSFAFVFVCIAFFGEIAEVDYTPAAAAIGVTVVAALCDILIYVCRWGDEAPSEVQIDMRQLAADNDEIVYGED